MKFMILILFCVHCCWVQASEKVEFVANRVHSLLVFVDSISGTPNYPPIIKEEFEKSSFNTEEARNKLKILDELDAAYSRKLNFEGLPADRERGARTEDFIIIQSAFAKNLTDLQSRLLGVLQVHEISKLMEILKYFEPIHDKLLWNPYEKDLIKALKILETSAKKANFDKMFTQAAKFYSASWPEDQKFRISLFPIPPKSQFSTGRSYGAFESVGVIINEKDIPGRLGVIFHELCHSLYGAQTPEFQTQLSKWYLESKSPAGKIAYSWINEAFATTIGNGWAYFNVTGKKDKQNWYHQPIIDGYGKALYPLIVEYLEKNKSMDQSFVEKSISIFETTFPNALNDIGLLITNIQFVSDGSFGSTRPLGLQLRKAFRVQSMNSSSPLNHPTTLEEIKKDETKSVFIVLKWKEKNQIEILKPDFPLVYASFKKAHQGKNLSGLFDVNGRKFIVSAIKDDQHFEYLLEKLKKMKKFEKLNEFVDLDTIP